VAGHSKWANIQYRKSRQDASRSRLFSRLAREITVAAKRGDPDPENNPRLRLAIKEARSNSVSKEVIKRALSKATGSESENFEEIRYEGYGPGGIAMIVETMTDNRNRTAASVRSIFSKSGGSLAETGAVSFMFERKGLVLYPASVGTEEEILDIAVDAGAEDVESSDTFHEIYCDLRELNEVSQSMEAILGESDSSRLIWKPVTTTPLDAEGAQKVIKLVETLEQDDDVQSVTANFDISDEVMAKLMT